MAVRTGSMVSAAALMVGLLGGVPTTALAAGSTHPCGTMQKPDAGGGDAGKTQQFAEPGGGEGGKTQQLAESGGGEGGKTQQLAEAGGGEGGKIPQLAGCQ